MNGQCFEPLIIELRRWSRVLSDIDELKLNEIGTVSLQTMDRLVFDNYSQNRVTGSFILIDEMTNDTVAAGMIKTAG